MPSYYKLPFSKRSKCSKFTDTCNNFSLNKFLHSLMLQNTKCLHKVTPALTSEVE